MITRPIDSRHDTLQSAVQAANLDLSFNPREAQDAMQALQSLAEFKGALVSRGQVFYLYEHTRYGKMLNRFEPFVGGISDAPLHIAIIDDKISIINDVKIDKRNHELRKSLASRNIYLIDSFEATR